MLRKSKICLEVFFLKLESLNANECPFIKIHIFIARGLLLEVIVKIMFQYQSGTEGAAQYFSFLELIGFQKHICTNVGTTIMGNKYFHGK